jgi:uncharacterized YigZ family protein
MLFDDTYKSISEKSTGDYLDRGSKFIGEAFPLLSEEDAKKITAETKKKHPKANHTAYAYRLTPDRTVFKISDDREPSGSAGRPILNVMLSNDLTDVIILVSRYFGGTLLGIPGLINAYRSAAQNALTNAIIISKTVNEKYQLYFHYEQLNEVMTVLKKEEAFVTMKDFKEDCSLIFEIRKSKAENLISRIKNSDLISKGCKITAVK